MLLPYIRIVILCCHHNFRYQLLQAWSIKTISLQIDFVLITQIETHMLTKLGWEENNTIGKWPKNQSRQTLQKNNILQPLRLNPNMSGYVLGGGRDNSSKKQTCSCTSNSSFQTGKKGFGRSSTPPKNPKEDDRGVSTPHFFGNLRDPDASSAIRGWEDPPR